MAPSGQLYKIKLANGRVVGPIGLDRIRQLILKKWIRGVEVCREHPEGSWRDINQFPEIATLIVRMVEGKLTDEAELSESGGLPGVDYPGAATVVLPDPIPSGPTVMVPTEPEPGPEPESSLELESEEMAPEPAQESPIQSDPATEAEPKKDVATQVLPPEEGHLELHLNHEEESTRIQEEPIEPTQVGASGPVLMQPIVVEEDALPEPRKLLSEMKTIVFQRPRNVDLRSDVPRTKASQRHRIISILAALSFIYIGYEAFFDAPPRPSEVVRRAPIRPVLPALEGRPDPKQSAALYQKAMKYYVQDTVVGYTQAANYLQLAVKQDTNNVKALAMLASAYLNLIDSSNKDENYFKVIFKLIELSRAKKVDLPETVIADVEFYLAANKAEAAQNRIVEYTKLHEKFEAEMFYYIALAFYSRGDYPQAAQFLANYPENRAFSPAVFLLRGLLSERLGDDDQAMREYGKAIKAEPTHAKSRLRIADLLARRGKLKEAGQHLEFLVQNRKLLAPRDLAKAYFLHAQLSELKEQVEVAVGDTERAIILDPENHDYLLELFTLRAKLGDKSPLLRAEAKMYLRLSEGERMAREGKYHEALTKFLEAREAFERSPLPFVKMGDMFSRLHDLSNARINYRAAAEHAPKSIAIWSKYINILIESFEWQEAQQAMDRFRKMDVPQSAIDKLAADMYAKQGKHAEAQALYRKAMSREVIAPEVYIAFAKSLMATQNYVDAPFFFALALRLDPLNTEAIVGNAQCIANSDSIDRGIEMLQDELKKEGAPRAELLAAIAELQIQKGDWDEAQKYVDQSKALNPELALPWKIQAQIEMNKEGVERGALGRALEAYKSFSERNPSDPTGYIERYRIFMKRNEFENADEELVRIYAIYPKYPNLHYLKGLLYSQMGNKAQAIEELKIELANNPASVHTLIELGRELTTGGQPEDALKFLNKAIALAPRNADARSEAGYAHFLMKNYAGAVALLQTAVALDKANPLLIKRLGLALREAGDGAAAARAFQRYLELEPDAPDRDQFLRYR